MQKDGIPDATAHISPEQEAVTTPAEWPDEVAEAFSPIRPLGKGGFASVMLARRKHMAIHNDTDHPTTSDDEYVAIKIIGASHLTKMEVSYAYREIYILQEISHTNICRLLQSWKPPHSPTCAAAMALQYAPGPTLQSLIDFGGALSIPFARVVMAQVVDAIFYLHSRAVLHRDIKPDNIIVSGASASQDEIWDAVSSVDGDQEADWRHFLAKWHVTLIDFGFARALTPKDFYRQHVSSTQLKTLADDDDHHHEAVSAHQDRLDRSRHIARAMSAVGHRAYAAPEVRGGLTKNLNTRRFAVGSIHKGIDVDETLTSNIAKYGLQADAFSLGSNLLHCLTGIRPDADADAVIDNENAPIILLLRWICCADKVPTGKRRVNHKRLSAAPVEVRKLVHGLRHPDPAQRLTVHRLRMTEWINSVLADRMPLDVDNVQFLSIALKEGVTKDT